MTARKPRESAPLPFRLLRLAYEEARANALENVGGLSTLRDEWAKSLRNVVAYDRGQRAKATRGRKAAVQLPPAPVLPKIHGCAMLIVPLGEVAPYPLLHVMVEEEGPSRFSGIVSGPGGPAAGLVGADCGTHASLGALSLRAKEIGEAHLAATEPPLPDVEGA